MSVPGSSDPSSTRTSSGWKMRPCTSSMGRTSDDCETSKWTWASGPRTTGSEVSGRDALEVAAGLSVHRGARDSVVAVYFDRDGRPARNPPLRRRHPRTGADGDAARSTSLVHRLDRMARGPDRLRVVLRPIPAPDRSARTWSDRVHRDVGGRSTPRVSLTQLRR